MIIAALILLGSAAASVSQPTSDVDALPVAFGERSRAEVKAETARALRDGTFWSSEQNRAEPLSSSTATRTRAEVRAEAIESARGARKTGHDQF